MVAYLRHRMDEFDISIEDLAASMAEDQRRAANARYRSATGDTWDGQGDMPPWLKQAISAGQSTDHFAIIPDKPRSAERAEIDWSKDPFAGSRLAAARSGDTNA